MKPKLGVAEHDAPPGAVFQTIEAGRRSLDQESSNRHADCHTAKLPLSGKCRSFSRSYHDSPVKAVADAERRLPKVAVVTREEKQDA